MIIGITGKKNAGKDTAAAYLVERYDFKRIGYADTLKEAAAALFQVPATAFDYHKNNPQVRVQLVRHYDTPGLKDCTEYMSEMTMRLFLQRMGTEMGREVFGTDFWVEQLKRKAKNHSKVVIPDVRFANEVTPCDYVIEVVRDIANGADKHASEAGIDEYLISHVITNNGTIEELHEKVEACLQEMLSSVS